MRRTYQRLSALEAKRLATQGIAGMHADGGNLYLCVAKSGAVSWIFRFMFAGRVREMGLGAYRDVSLSEARTLADAARALKRQGVDPLDAKQAKKATAAVARVKTVTFAEAAKAYMQRNQASWKSADHRRQWANSLERYVFPIIGHLPVESIDTPLVLKVLEQPVKAAAGADNSFWTVTPESASRVRNRVEIVLNAAKARGSAIGDNPARWVGHLETLLPNPKEVKPVVHHPALHYAEMPAFMIALRALEDADARALELAILTGLRTSEILTTPWSEFNDRDLSNRLWVIPKERMKAKRDHRVALSARALAIIEQQRAIRSTDYVFAGNKGGGHADEKTLLRVLQRRLKRRDLTAHGFRSTFRDWAGEETEFANEVCELALAHAVGNRVEEAYRRGDMFRKRVALAEAWDRYCGQGEAVPPEILSLHRQAG